MKKSSSFAVFVDNCLRRYQREDWGDVDNSEALMNEYALDHGDDYIMGRYKYNNRAVRGWDIEIVTNWSRTKTLVKYKNEDNPLI